MAPIAPEPLTPVVSTPENDITEIEARTLWERLAANDGITEPRGRKGSPDLRAAALNIGSSAPKPRSEPPPETLLTVVLAPDR